MGGKDAASARYIYTRLSSITRKLFDERDDAVSGGVRMCRKRR
jgi:DNA gyrase/topoisomerase IV subunit A